MVRRNRCRCSRRRPGRIRDTRALRTRRSRIGFRRTPHTPQEDSMPTEAGKIRNVAVVGHRGTGKTSLVEAMLFQAGKTNRLGTIDAGTTVSDWEEDEQRRSMSLAASLCHCDWQERKLNLVDTPGDS